MKKIGYLLALVWVVLMLFGCGRKGNGWFDAEVKAVDATKITVKPVDNPEAAASKTVKNADEVLLSLEGFGIEISSGELKKGDKIRVLFNEDGVDEKGIECRLQSAGHLPFLLLYKMLAGRCKVV